MKCLVDENLPRGIAIAFQEIGFVALSVLDNESLRGRPDGAIFEYASMQNSVLVTRDLGFIDRMLFTHPRPLGLVIVRFPSHVSLSIVIEHVRRSLRSLESEDYQNNIVILEPGLTRIRRVV